MFHLSGDNDPPSIKHYIEKINPDTVVAVGGDGTVRLLAKILKETPTALGILPAGSANGMAKELNIPADANEALNILINGKCTPIDLVKINEEELSIHLSDIGLNAMIVKYFDEFKGRGWLTYGKALIKVLWKKRKFRCTIKTDSAELKRKAYMVVIANASKYGSGGVINPEGDVADGCFEVVIVRKLNLFSVLNGIFHGKPFHPEKIEVIKTKSLDIALQRKTYFQVDGEYLGKTATVSARVLPQILHVMVPAGQ